MIGSCVKIGLDIFQERHLPVDVVKKLDDLTWFSLNPLSHNNPYKDFYRSELETAFKVYDALLAIEQKVLIPNGTTLTFDIERTDGTAHHYTLELKKDMYINIDAVNKSYELLDLGLKLSIVEGKRKPCELKNVSLIEVYKETVETLTNRMHEDVIDQSEIIYDEIKVGDKSINQLITELIVRERRILHIA